MKKFLIFTILALLTMVNCATQKAVKQTNVSADQVAVMSVTISDVIDDNNAIAVTNDKFHRTIKLKDETANFFEGQLYKGSFVFIGTYRYQDELRKSVRVLPVYMPSKSYVKSHKR